MIVAVLYLMSLLFCYPFLRHLDDKLALLAAFQILLLLMAGAVVQNGDDVTRGSATDIVMSVILFIVVGVLVILFFYHGVLFLRLGYRMRQRKFKIDNEEKNNAEDINSAAQNANNNEPISAEAGSDGDAGVEGIELQVSPLHQLAEANSATSPAAVTQANSHRALLSPAQRRLQQRQQFDEGKQ